MIYLTFSTGIGAGIVVNDDVLFGKVGEIGHMTVDPTATIECGCGGTGHWEAYCGGANVPRYSAHIQRIEEFETDLAIGDGTLTAKDIFTSVGVDALADCVIDRIGFWNSIGVANVIQAYTPTYIAIGGSIALHNPEIILEPIQNSVPDRIMVEMPTIELTRCGPDVVVRGALALAHRIAV
jgi:glucokinase